MSQVFVRILKRASRSALFYATCITLLTVVAIAWSLLSAKPLTPSTLQSYGASATSAAKKGGWGESAISSIHGSFAACSPIAAANACGMGASSCFKCHSSGRGPAISNSVWHTDHEQVNNDCVGCHQGSPWILKKSLAHAGLIADPLTTPDKSCATCHQGKNLAQLVASYIKVKTPQNK